MVETMHFPCGSEWRRWDLHIHSPASARAVSFSGWNDYVAELEKAPPEVAVIGITDYASIEGYKILQEYRAAGRLSNFALVLPNIEFRLSLITRDRASVNMHLLFSPEHPNHVHCVEDALCRLTFEFQGQRYPCTRTGMVNLGRASNPRCTSDEAAYAEGNNQFKLELSTLRDWLKQERWARDNCLIIVSNKSSDGASGINPDGSFRAVRDELYHIADAIFSADPSDRDYFLGKRADSPEDLIRKYRGLKPCVHGSDAHDLERLFRPDQNRFCWIKADPTFEGLRQILYEPDERVTIGPTPRVLHDRARVIRSVSVIEAGDCLPAEPILLNSGLVAIIGQKGAGKSALAELIAYACGSWYSDDGVSFLDRAREHVNGTRVKVEWHDGSTTETVIGEEPPHEQLVRYLSQRFVERLCSEDYGANELVKEIEKVVFAHLEPTETLNASSFKELRALRTERFDDERRYLKAEITRLLQEREALKESTRTLLEKKARMEQLAKERDDLQKQLPTTAAGPEAELAQSVRLTREQINGVQATIAAAKEQLVRLETARTRIRAFAADMQRFHREIGGLLRELGLSEEGIALFRPSFAGDTKAPLGARERVLKAEIAKLEGDSADPAVGTLRFFRQALGQLEKQVTDDQAMRDKSQAVQKRLTAIAAEERRLHKEIMHIQAVHKPRFQVIREDLITSYLKHFGVFREEKEQLAELYSPVSERLQGGDAQEQKLEFFVRWNVDIDQWLQRGTLLFDQRYAQPFGSLADLERRVRSELEPALKSADEEKIREAITKFIELLSGGKLNLRSSVSHTDLLTWVLDVSHIGLSYGLKYNNIPLEKLSPGAKGVVLLILYLGMDSTDSRPLIIDQPEENLDNESIYNLLAHYFKRSKICRQIIIVTHNPNLVVNTDAEQIIVATSERRDSGLPQMRYLLGSLENSTPVPPGIRQHACRILEGGEAAFHKREQRYALR